VVRVIGNLRSLQLCRYAPFSWLMVSSWTLASAAPHPSEPQNKSPRPPQGREPPPSSRGTTLISACAHSDGVRAHTPVGITANDPGQVYSGGKASLSVDGSGRIFGWASASGLHQARTRWAAGASLLVSISA